MVSPDTLDKSLTAATAEFVDQHVTVSLSKKEVVVPKLFKWFSKDFGDIADTLQWICKYIGPKKKKDLTQLLTSNAQFQIKFQYDRTPSPCPFRQTLSL